MRVFSVVAALALLAPVAAVQKTKALKALADIGELKSMDMEVSVPSEHSQAARNPATNAATLS